MFASNNTEKSLKKGIKYNYQLLICQFFVIKLLVINYFVKHC